MKTKKQHMLDENTDDEPVCVCACVFYEFLLTKDP